MVGCGCAAVVYLTVTRTHEFNGSRGWASVFFSSSPSSTSFFLFLAFGRNKKKQKSGVNTLSVCGS